MSIDSISVSPAPAPPSLEAAASLYALGGPEAAVAAAILRLDELRHGAERAEQRLRADQHAEERRAIDEQRRAARAGLVGGLAQGGLQLVGAAVKMADLGSSSAEAGGDAASGAATDAEAEAAAAGEAAEQASSSKLADLDGLIDPAADLAGIVADALRGQRERLAASHQVSAKQAADVADQHEADARRAGQLADRALDHLDSIANARTQALLAASRA